MSEAGSAGGQASGEASDLEAIQQLKTAYARCVDGKEWAQLEALLAPDFEFGDDSQSSGAATFVRLVSSQLADAVTAHHLGEPDIEIQSPIQAFAVWPFEDLIDQRQEGVGPSRRGFGQYREEYKKTGGRWRISRMHISRSRIECTAHLADGTERTRTCGSQEEVVAWLAEQRASDR